MTTVQAALVAAALVAAALVGSVIFMATQGVFSQRAVEASSYGPNKSAGGASLDFGCAKPDVDAYLRDADAIMAEFGDAAKRADSTPRLALSPAIADMQAAQRKFAALKPPPCAVEFQSKIDSSMNECITGMLAFLADERTDVSLYAARAAADIKAANLCRERIEIH